MGNQMDAQKELFRLDHQIIHSIVDPYMTSNCLGISVAFLLELPLLRSAPYTLRND